MPTLRTGRRAGEGGRIQPSLRRKALAAAKRALAPDRRTVVFDVAIKVANDNVELTGEVHSAALERQLLAHLREAGATELRSQLTTLPSATVGTRTFGAVSLSVANLRSKPAIRKSSARRHCWAHHCAS